MRKRNSSFAIFLLDVANLYVIFVKTKMKYNFFVNFWWRAFYSGFNSLLMSLR